MSHVLHRQVTAVLPTAVRGDGAYLVDAEGRRYLDASGSVAVSCLGHNHPAVIDAIKAQLDRLPFAHGGFFTTEPMEALAEALAALAPGPLDYAWFCSGGSEAVESALKIARQYHVERGEASRYRVIARRQSYHGTTLGALSVGASKWRRELFAPLLLEAHHIAPCYPYRGLREGEEAQSYGQRVADELEAKIVALGPETVAAFIAEPVVGATLGAVPPVPGYFRRIREICTRHGVLLILDEVMCGTGRTGSYFAYEQEDVQPDLVTLAKGLAAGYAPIGAVMVSREIRDTLAAGSRMVRHGFTFQGHAAACAGALATIEALRRENLMAAVRARGQELGERLLASLGEHRHVGDVRGRGLLWGVELVADRASKAPFPAAAGLARRIHRRALEHGLLCYARSGTADGVNGDHVLLAPPFVIGEGEIERMAGLLAEAIDGASAEITR